MKIAQVVALGIVLMGSYPGTASAGGSNAVDEAYRKLVATDDALMQDWGHLSDSGSSVTQSVLEARIRQLESDYQQFLSEHPKHVRAMVAFGGFLRDFERDDEAIAWWKKAIAVDKNCAAAYNDLGEVYGPTGQAAEALRMHQKAYELDPSEPVYRLNWANTCILFRTDAHEVYGWDTAEIFRRSLEQFRKARDLAPQDLEFSNAYAESFYLVKNPDWREAHAAWEYCLGQPLQTAERQRVYGQLARVSMYQNRLEEAKSWLAKMDAPEVQGLRESLQRRLSQLTSSKPVP